MTRHDSLADGPETEPTQRSQTTRHDDTERHGATQIRCEANAKLPLTENTSQAIKRSILERVSERRGCEELLQTSESVVAAAVLTVCPTGRLRLDSTDWPRTEDYYY
jgi:hypothetical protein